MKFYKVNYIYDILTFRRGHVTAAYSNVAWKSDRIPVKKKTRDVETRVYEVRPVAGREDDESTIVSCGGRIRDSISTGRWSNSRSLYDFSVSSAKDEQP